MRIAAIKLATAVAVVALATTACGATISDKYKVKNEPATVEEVEGEEVWKVTLTSQATTRLGIETANVWTASEGLAVPSSALWLDTEGVFWVYMNPEPNVYLRHAVDVVDDDGERALISAGPPDGTVIVSVGVPELFGTEVGVGK